MSTSGEYRVLARKYRPTSFAELVGHETLVRTLSNAFSSGRIAHAFMLTGVRGIGKTTTARLIARALNCVGTDGQGGPTIDPCGICEPCRAIAEDRHPDVIEMDAASRTGVDDIRELIDGVRYHPVSARYKIYIIDEVHMLSRQAFNALLKTLEEPPPDIKFVFATTEINKVPITVLSRCQRYTLPRLSAAVLAGHYQNIAALEQVTIDPEAVALIARAADGSVRDGLSILDQAIALGVGGTITAEQVRNMLGVADRGLVYDLFESVMAGDAPAALSRLESFYNGGTDPAMVMQDLLEITHAVTRLKLEGGKPSADADVAEDDERRRGLALSAKLGIPALTRCWQILLKGLAEVQGAPNPLKAAEMVLVRLVYVTDLPPPAEIAGLLQRGGTLPSRAPGSQPAASGRGSEPVAQLRQVASQSLPAAQPVTALRPTLPQPQDFEAVVALIAEHREAILEGLVARHVRLVRFSPGHIEFQPDGNAPRDLSTRLAQFLLAATGSRWMISVTSEAGAPTLMQRSEAKKAERLEKAIADPLIQAALTIFPGAVIERVTDLTELAAGGCVVEEKTPAAVVEPEALNLTIDGSHLDTPAPYEEDDPGPFNGYDSDDEIGED